MLLVFEAWTKRPPTKEDTRPWLSDIKDPGGRREIIMAGALIIDGRAGFASAKILRDDQARISGYGEIESIACGSREENGEASAKAGILEPFFYGYVKALPRGN